MAGWVASAASRSGGLPPPAPCTPFSLAHSSAKLPVFRMGDLGMGLSCGMEKLPARLWFALGTRGAGKETQDRMEWHWTVLGVSKV